MALNLKCDVCSKSFKRCESLQKKRGKVGIFCSLLCYWKFKKGKETWLSKQMRPGVCFNTGRTLFKKGQFAKEKHPMWKGGISSFEYLERRRFKKEIQMLVFERDNYTCQICGNQKDLQVDHIQSWSDYVELRFSINNCRTLCTKCHYKITFGREMPKETKGWGHNFLTKEVQGL